jgi:hypothetical protein
MFESTLVVLSMIIHFIFNGLIKRHKRDSVVNLTVISNVLTSTSSVKALSCHSQLHVTQINTIINVYKVCFKLCSSARQIEIFNFCAPNVAELSDWQDKSHLVRNDR